LAYIELSQDLLADIAKLRPAVRRRTLLAVGASEFGRCADDVMYWLDASQHLRTPRWPEGLPYVFTNDPHPMCVCNLCGDGEAHHTIKRNEHLKLFHPDLRIGTSEGELRGFFTEIPGTRPFTIKPYVPPIINAWLTEPFMCIEKSRDMMATWLVVTLYAWDTLYHRNRQNIFQSENASKTNELVKRADFIYKNQPRFLKAIHKATYSIGQARSGMLVVPSLESELLGFPQGPDQIRQYHPSGLFSDEAAFQDAAGDSFSAVKPALQNGGRYTAVSSANPSFFWHLCRDTSDSIAS
jgi:hypothetical protein